MLLCLLLYTGGALGGDVLHAAEPWGLGLPWGDANVTGQLTSCLQYCGDAVSDFPDSLQEQACNTDLLQLLHQYGDIALHQLCHKARLSWLCLHMTYILAPIYVYILAHMGRSICAYMCTDACTSARQYIVIALVCSSCMCSYLLYFTLSDRHMLDRGCSM